MSLQAYNKKRSFTQTAEPKGLKAKESKGQLRFVIQKHAASHLHYDFRLEMDGVLKSWAVPKGPSTDPEVKRLAMMVEDHPYEYRNFEGIIPKGQYGGGTVIVWDEGTYGAAEPVEGDFKKQEKYLLRQLNSGKLKIVLHGQKLKGTYALVKANGKGDNGWLLMKLKDKHAGTTDITLKDKSVISKKTIEQVAKISHNVYGKAATKKSSAIKDRDPVKKSSTKSNGKRSGTRKQEEPDPVKKIARSVTKKRSSVPAAGSKLKTLLKKATRQPFYTKLKPMLATLVDKAFDQEGWLYEIKWDGYRAIGFSNKKEVALKSRNGKEFNEKFYPVYDALKEWKVNVIVDGEIVVVGADGRANFGALQNWRSEADGILIYYMFDILWYNGYNLKGLELTERKAILAEIAPDNNLIRISRDFEISGIEFLRAAKKMGLEGIMAKRKDSTYHDGDRSNDWLKIKANKRQEVVIGGYTRNVDTNKPFSSLLVGVFKGKEFIYTGKIGTGFNIKKQQEMLEQFEPLVINKPAFTEEPDVNKPSRFRPNPPNATAIWLKPKLICEVSFAEMTNDGVMRHPSFEGMREDKMAREVVLEKEVAVKTITLGGTSRDYIEPVVKGPRKTLLNPKDDSQVRKIGGHELKFTNLSKIFWPEEKITKRDLINYYYQAAPFILPYLKGRPQAMNRFPNGINGKSFYQKDVTGKVPDWMDTYGYHSKGDREDKQYLLGNNEATLLYMANQACIEMNPWSSTIKKPDNPTWCMIDFDPDKNTFNQVIEAMQITHQILDDMGISSYPKTSGSTGMHIYIPLGAKYTYEQSKELARIVVTLVHQELPKYTTLTRSVSDRKGKMYLDFLQNRAHATIAAPYSVRPKPGATVSMPLHWDEVKRGLKMKNFTLKNAIVRMESEGDIFKPVLGKGIDLKKILKAATNK